MKKELFLLKNKVWQIKLDEINELVITETDKEMEGFHQINDQKILSNIQSKFNKVELDIIVDEIEYIIEKELMEKYIDIVGISADTYEYLTIANKRN